MQWAHCLSCTFCSTCSTNQELMPKRWLWETISKMLACWSPRKQVATMMCWSFQLVTFLCMFCLQGSCKAFVCGSEDMFTNRWFNYGLHCGTGWPGKTMGHFWQKTFPATMMRSHPWWIYSCFVSILYIPTRRPIRFDSLPLSPPIAWEICNNAFSSLWRGLSTMWCLRWWPSRTILSQCHPDAWEG